MDNRNKRFVLNSAMSLAQQLVTVICGLILPQLILKRFGSTVNGLTASITQFLSFITLLQGGVGTVARLAFYKPLAENDRHKISVAYKTVSVFYQKFAGIYVVYLVALCVLYPILVSTGFEFAYVAMLVLILGLASVFEYFFGQASQMLLFAAQKNYIYSVAQIVCTIVSTILGVLLVQNGASIHMVKLISAAVYAFRPMILYRYANKKYNIEKNAKSDNKLLSQRNAALIRHIAYYVHTSTDIMVLTLCSNVLWVSVYSVHRYVVNSLSNLVSAVIGNTEVVFGDMIARKEYDTMKKQVPVYDLFTKILSCTCFFTCMILISRFVNIYTKGVEDINYEQPLFAVLLVMSELIYCMGVNYQNIYIAAGHIHKTEWIAVTEAIINIVISVVTVWHFGIVGVAFGTVVAMTFKTIANIYYMKKNVFDLPTKFIVTSYAINLGIGFVMFWLSQTVLYYPIHNYIEFFIYAAITFLLVGTVFVVGNAIVFKNEMSGVLAIVKKKVVMR